MLSVIVPTRLLSEQAPRPLASLSGQHGQAAARNRGAAEARNDSLVFIDDDVELPVHFLRRVHRYLADGADVVVPDLRIGRWVPDTAPIRVERRVERGWRGRRPVDVPVGFDEMVFAATGIRRASFEHVGGFDWSFTEGEAYGNEDVDLGYRLLREGAAVRRAVDVVVFTDEPHELGRLLVRARKVGRNDVRLVRRHPELAGDVFGRKLVDSRIERVVETAILRVPSLGLIDAPLRWVVARFVHEGPEGPVRTRLWFALRALHYRLGVADARGFPLVRAARSAAALSRAGRSPRRAVQTAGAEGAGPPSPS